VAQEPVPEDRGRYLCHIFTLLATGNPGPSTMAREIERDWETPSPGIMCARLWRASRLSILTALGEPAPLGDSTELTYFGRRKVPQSVRDMVEHRGGRSGTIQAGSARPGSRRPTCPTRPSGPAARSRLDDHAGLSLTGDGQAANRQNFYLEHAGRKIRPGAGGRLARR